MPADTPAGPVILLGPLDALRKVRRVTVEEAEAAGQPLGLTGCASGPVLDDEDDDETGDDHP